MHSYTLNKHKKPLQKQRFFDSISRRRVVIFRMKVDVHDLQQEYGV